MMFEYLGALTFNWSNKLNLSPNLMYWIRFGPALVKKRKFDFKVFMKSNLRLCYQSPKNQDYKIMEVIKQIN